MKRGILLALAVVLVAAGPARAGDEEQLARRVRRFYTYYYLDHFDDMWDVFHPSLKERLGGDRKAYIRSLRDSDLELYSADVEQVRVQGDRGVADVSLVFFYEGIGQPIPRRHRMFWIREGGKWWYAGSRLLEGEGALKGEAPEASVEEQEEPPPPRVTAPDAPPAVAGKDRGVPSGRPETVGAPAPAPVPAVTGLPEEAAPSPAEAARRQRALPQGQAAAGPPGPLPSSPPSAAAGSYALAKRLREMGVWNREKRLRNLVTRLVPEDIPGLAEAANTADQPVRKWAVTQIARLARRTPEVREEASTALLEFLVGPGTGLRAEAARGLGLLRVDRARRPLEDLLLQGNSVQRAAAGAALGDLGDPRSSGPLYQVWKRTLDPALRAMLLRALGATVSPEGTTLLLDVAGDTTCPLEERLAALEGLQIGSRPELAESLAALDERLETEGTSADVWRLRALLAAARFRQGDPEASAAVKRLARTTSPSRPLLEGAELGHAIADRGDLDTARLLLQRPETALRHAGAVAVAEMRAAGNAEAAAAAAQAAEHEQDRRIVLVLLPSSER